MDHASGPIKYRSITEVAKLTSPIPEQVASLPFTHRPALTLALLQQPDGTWEQSSSTSTDIEFAVERLAARRRRHPDFEHRLVRRITSVTLQAACAE